MLLALFRVPWSIIPLAAAAGYIAGIAANADHKTCLPVPGPTLQQQATAHESHMQELVWRQSEKQLQGLINVCRTIESTNPTMLTPHCREVLYPQRYGP